MVKINKALICTWIFVLIITGMRVTGAAACCLVKADTFQAGCSDPINDEYLKTCSEFNKNQEIIQLYPKDEKYIRYNEKISNKLLTLAKDYQNRGNFDEALYGYKLILQGIVPKNINNQAYTFHLLAENKQPVIKNYRCQPEFAQMADAERNKFNDKQYNIDAGIEYIPFGDYMNFSSKLSYKQSENVTFDKDGMPMYKYYGIFRYNPVTICQYALTQYGKYLKGQNTGELFLECADFLVNYMKDDGSLRYDFELLHYETLPEGWTSSMAQGQALSVFARAYKITGDYKYIIAGNKALEYLITPVSNGGVMDTLESLDPDLKDYVFFQEYVYTNSSYTLNGYIFTLLGLYDWSRLMMDNITWSMKTAKRYYDEGIKTLKYILPYYDYGGFTTYDLHHFTSSSAPCFLSTYHALHIEQLGVVYSLTKDPYFKKIQNIWSSY